MAFAFNAATIEDSLILNSDTTDSKLSKKTLDNMMVNNIENIHNNLDDDEKEENFNYQSEVKPIVKNEESYSLLSYNEAKEDEYSSKDTLLSLIHI